MKTMQAQLFASYDEFVSLYKPLKTGEPIPPATKMCNFEYELLLPSRRTGSPFIMTVEFWNDRAHSIYFSKTDDSEIDADEVQQLLNQNSGGASWGSRPDQPQFIFRSDNKAVASYDSDRKSFSMQGRELLSLRAKQREQASAAASPARVGQYALGQLITDYPNARKFSWWDNFMEKRKVPGETLYRAADRADFLGASWGIVLGVVQNRIYKISARWSSKTEAPMTAMLFEVIDYCRRQFGVNMTGSKQDAAIWQTSFGTVTVNAQSVTTGGSRGIYLITFEMIATLNVGGGFLHANN
jgi:hypothetical protein